MMLETISLICVGVVFVSFDEVVEGGEFAILGSKV